MRCGFFRDIRLTEAFAKVLQSGGLLSESAIQLSK